MDRMSIDGNAGVITMELSGHRHVKRDDADGSWIAVGNDSQFLCLSDKFPLPGGWYHVDLRMQRLKGPEMWPYFYPFYGDWENLEKHKVFVPFFNQDGGEHQGIVRLTHDVLQLRFDPSVAVGKFTLDELKLQRVGKARAAKEMLQGVLWRPAGVFTKIRWLSSLLVQGLIGGPSGFAERLYRIYSERPTAAARVAYDTWVELYDASTPERLEAERAAIGDLVKKPLFSIIMPAYNTPEKWLRKCVESVKAQVYPHWELCIANDASPAPHVRRVLDELAAGDSRIKVVHREANGHISAASNSAIEVATGEWLVLLDHDDELHPLALSEVAKEINEHPDWRLIYSDEDKIDERGRRYDPYMKPDWNYDLFLSHNCISHLGVYDAALVREVGGFQKGLEGSQDWDLALRCVERLTSKQVGHIPKVLYHWRAIVGSTALAPQEKDYAHDAGMRAIAAHLERIGSKARVQDIPGQRGNYRMVYPLPSPAPKVSIIIPTRDKVGLLRACIESVSSLTTYPDYEIIIVDNQSEEAETLAYFRELESNPRVRVLPYDKPFNYSEINNYAVSEAKGSVICLLNNDITVITPGWLEEMVGHALRPDVGAVGAILYYPNNTIQHAGVILGAHGVAAHAYSGQARGYPGHMSRARLTQSMSAVTAACLVVRRDTFERVEGFDPALQVAFNDVDLCLRIGRLGLRNIWTPFAELYHHESASRGYEDTREKAERFNAEMIYMRSRWGETLRDDPSYSPNFSIDDELFELSFPPRERKASPV